jgi:hypothetical protein
VRAAIAADIKSSAPAAARQVITPVQAHEAPEGWSVVAGQDNLSRLIRDRIRDGWYGAKIASGDSLSLVKSVSGRNVLITTRLMSIPKAVGSSCGVYLTTKDGASLKLEGVSKAEGPVVRFSAASGGQDAKSREVPVKAGGQISLSIHRSNDRFTGEMSADGKSTKIGTLVWSGLAESQDVGIIAECERTDAPSPALTIFQFGNLYGGPPQQ